MITNEMWDNVIFTINNNSGGIKMTALISELIANFPLFRKIDDLPTVLEDGLKQRKDVSLLYYVWKPLNREKIFVYTV